MAVLVALALTGLHGVVMRGPTQPVCQVGQPCTAPAANVSLVFARRGRIAARVRTDDRGTYSVRLRPGTYTVRVAPQPTIGSGLRPSRVSVMSGPAHRVNFFIDTGIR